MIQSNPRILRPHPLQKGDCIGVVAPSSPFPKEPFTKGIQTLKGRGFNVWVPQNIFRTCRSFLAGSDADRAGTLMEMFTNPEVHAIMTARGGYGCQRILDKLDAEEIRRHPKIVIGYSDVTFLLLYLLDHCGIIPFHGPMVVELADASLEIQDQLLTTLTHVKPLGKIPLRNPIWIKEGWARGALVGGNLSVVCSTLGTPWEVRTEGRLLFIEEHGEAPFRIDRMLHQLQTAGKLDAANGLVFGDILQRASGGNESTEAYEEAILGILEDVTKFFSGPVLKGLPVGHGKNNTTLPLGVEAVLNAEENALTVTESALEGDG
jgi:muramoyltetrapeptide carboxypeptidase